jgi:hypothetical protein
MGLSQLVERTSHADQMAICRRSRFVSLMSRRAREASWTEPPSIAHAGSSARKYCDSLSGIILGDRARSRRPTLIVQLVDDIVVPVVPPHHATY